MLIESNEHDKIKSFASIEQFSSNDLSHMRQDFYLYR